ncbi:hypothetical protein L198_01644 [Cryptococcus wingfieldii CBS 7118]|uniref:Uncharacterized protein n=1 Tax=Cryptococcus wingfieldii CBS 7118 TaxID=1295528 RepID=A0A1E3K2H2_9TREE|nr:hypothetical protein L198_01644 [Cryptococcus wingfieldii CBS 7118]ODO06412.1 hypothetical protein L198_01644 [Cryptococcus wingfieldii CBS 7118]
MGADGGSIPDRRDLVKTKGKTEQLDKAAIRELFLFCALSRKPLTKPVVIDPIGKIYNKDDLIEYFLDKSKYGDGDQICGHLKGVKDLITLNLTSNPDYVPPSTNATSTINRAPFACPLSLREMAGSFPFVALRSCGCVFSDAAIRAVVPNLTKGVTAQAAEKDELPEEARPVVNAEEKSKQEVACPNCNKAFDPTSVSAIIPINPPKEVQEVLLENLVLARAAAKSSKKRKADKVDKSSKVDKSVDGASLATDAPPMKTARTSSSSPAPRAVPSVSQPPSVARSVQEKLLEQERKRLQAQQGMSDAVKSMFKSKKDEGEKRSGMEDFFGRTFTRYAA